jgi:release factor glutamine methyltransferase
LTPDIKAGDALRQATEQLRVEGIASPRLTAEVLLAHALRRDRTWLYAHPEHPLSELEWIHFGRAVYERQTGKPTQYITRCQEFYSRPFLVTPAVLIPRPETEHVVEAALQLNPRPGRILDLCTGSGAIGITLALELRRPVVLADLSLPALQVARHNADQLEADAELICMDCAAAISSQWELITANPPYVPQSEIEGLQREVRDYEPHLALNGGEFGMNIYSGIVRQATQLLVSGGHLVLEMGYRTEHFLRPLFFLGLWHEPVTLYDLAGLPRVLVVSRR